MSPYSVGLGEHSVLLRAESIAIVLLFINIHTTARRNNRVVVQNRVAGEIMSLDVVHIDTLIHSGHLINVSYVVEQVGVFSDKLFVGLEINHVDLQFVQHTTRGHLISDMVSGDMFRGFLPHQIESK